MASMKFDLLHFGFIFPPTLSFQCLSELKNLCFFVFSSFADLNNIPSDLPSDIVKMDLSSNSIKHLRPKQFLLSKDLKLLNLSSNSLRHIDTGTTVPPSETLHIWIVQTLQYASWPNKYLVISWQVFIKII